MNKNLGITVQIFNILTIFLFVTVIILPGLRVLTQPPLAASVSENRVLAQPPDIELSSFSEPEKLIASVEAYIKDQFGYREDLIHANAYFRALYLHQISSPRAMIGKDDWLYLISNELIDDARGVIGMTDWERQTWESYFRTRYEWAVEHGILYIVVMAPEKQSIYPEYLPDGYRPVVENNTRFDNLVEVLANVPEKQTIYPEQLPDEYKIVTENNTRLDQMLVAFSDTVNMLDLRPDLLNAKDDAQIYRKVDTHWTGYGAFLAYNRFSDSSDRPIPMFFS